MSQAVKLSAVIITYNEERNIERCLASLQGVVDEIVVLDSNSTDSTKDICLQYNVAFHSQAFVGHIEQKNKAVSLAKYDHVLALDADEALSDELKKSIIAAKNNWQNDGWRMNRLTNYCGRWIRHGSWYPDTKTRLWDRRKGQWGGMNPHDQVTLADGSSLAKLNGDLLHYSYYTVREHVERSEKYAFIAAGAMAKLGKKASIWQIIFSPSYRFWRDYLLKAGFKDGFEGFFIATISGYSTFLKYGYRYLHQQGKQQL
ncbi:glycosyltransferase family 2 protein [Fulvivirgaceae bacterium LMO-SS25]